MDILGIIPARGGSKSIPRKNIIELAGKPLLAYTCEAARESKNLTKIVLSTDSEDIAEVGRSYGIEVPELRPQELAQDDTGMLPVILHMLEVLKRAQNYEPSIIVLLQPTSPLRTSAHIDAAVDILIKTKADSVVSVIETPHQFNPVSVMRIKDGSLTPYMQGPQILRRQDKPKVYSRNGPAVLAVRTETILKKNSLYGDHIRPLVMLPEESIDIDTPFDLKIAECILRKLQNTF